jgi:transposase InsO family protein
MSWSISGLQRVRADFVMIAREDDACVSAACRRFGISRKTGYKWLRRYKEEGLAGLTDLSRRPHSSPLRLSGDAAVALVKLHDRYEDWGPKKLRARLIRDGHCPDRLPSLATVARLARRLGWTESKGRGRPRRNLPVGPLTGAGQPNDVWTVDFKGHWRTRDGRRCEPLSIRDLYSRYIICLRPMVRRSTEAVRQVFVEVFERYGLPMIIRTDNGSPFASLVGPAGLTRLSAWWRSLGIRLERIMPGHPEQNGGHERMHGDIAREIESRPSDTTTEEAERLEHWQIVFNVERPHEALGMKTPGEAYRQSQRRLEDVKPYAYPTDMTQRRVRRDGCIRLLGRYVYLSEALGKMEVGLEQLSENCWRVWFCDLAVSELELIEGRIRRRPVAAAAAAGGTDCNPCPDNKVLPMSRS